jgi:hypothetical protein
MLRFRFWFKLENFAIKSPRTLSIFTTVPGLMDLSLARVDIVNGCYDFSLPTPSSWATSGRPKVKPRKYNQGSLEQSAFRMQRVSIRRGLDQGGALPGFSFSSVEHALRSNT